MLAPTTKLRIPRPRGTLVDRARLGNPFHPARGPSPRLVLLSAPPGFGKTTLLAQWLTAEPAPDRVCWVTLDEQDADVRQFLGALVSSLGQWPEGIGGEARAMLDNDRALPATDIVAGIANDLDGVAGRTVVALDDYHRAGSPAVHEAVALLVDNLPPLATVAITTRSDPPLPLASWRARGELLEVRAPNLRFTVAESDSFLGGVMGLDLDAAQVAELERRTEGWVAGLQLAALSTRSREATSAWPGVPAPDFSGSHRFVVDYLVDEVLDAQSDERRTFLVLTSVLEQLTAPLCDAVTGRAGAQQQLEGLERDNVFLVAVDERRRWYRYHHLFADALRARLAAEQPDRVAELHHRASRWYAAEGLLDDALHHAVKAGDPIWLAVLVEGALPGWRTRRLDRTIARWLDALPDAVLRGSPVLSTTRAWSRLLVGDVPGAAAWLDVAALGASARGINRREDGELPESLAATLRDELRTVPATIEIYRAALAQAVGDVDATVRHARAAEAAAGPTDHLLHGAASGFLGLAAWAAGDLADGIQVFRRAVAHLGAAGNVTDQLGATVVLATMAVANGRPDEGRQHFERALREAEAHPEASAAVTGDLHVGLADVLREQGDLSAAVEHLRIARGLGDSAGLPENRFRWHSCHAAVLSATGDLVGAIDELDRAQQQYRPGYFPDTRPIPATRARFQVLGGRLAEARRWAEESQVAAADPAVYAREHDVLTRARLLVAEHRAGLSRPGEGLDATLRLLDRVVAAAEASGRGGSLVEARIVRALALEASGDVRRARAEVGVALTDGVPHGFCRVFLDEGTRMLALLRGLGDAGEGTPARLARQVLRSDGSPSTLVLLSPGAPQPLSQREIEVLNLLSSDMSGPEIAAHLFVSINTLRSHTKHIFTKLDVRTRRAAVRRAQELAVL